MSEQSVSNTGGIKLESLLTRIDYQGLVLAFLCALVTWLLLLGQKYTRDEIASRVAEDRLSLLTQVLPERYYDNQPLEESVLIDDKKLSQQSVEVYIARKQGQVSALVFQLVTIGWGGDITLMIALNTQGKILGVRVLSHRETPGLADKIEIDKSDWITRFNGESLNGNNTSQWAVKKDGGKFDQFTGATITPRAVVRGIYSGLQFYARNSDEIAMRANQASSETDKAVQ